MCRCFCTHAQVYMSCCLNTSSVYTHLDVVIEDQVLVLVALQECVGILQLEVLKLQHSLGPSAHDSLYELIQELQPARPVSSYAECRAGIPAARYALTLLLPNATAEPAVLCCAVLCCILR